MKIGLAWISFLTILDQCRVTTPLDQEVYCTSLTVDSGSEHMRPVKYSYRLIIDDKVRYRTGKSAMTPRGLIRHRAPTAATRGRNESKVKT